MYLLAGSPSGSIHLFTYIFTYLLVFISLCIYSLSDCSKYKTHPENLLKMSYFYKAKFSNKSLQADKLLTDSRSLKELHKGDKA